ncbi:hypothetical protein ES708_05574 [subsurface metagenome]
MRIGACGMACEICIFYTNRVCRGCLPGTDEAAPTVVQEFRQEGFTCPTLECAIKNKVAHCLSCDRVPCEVLYQGEMPYSNKLLDCLARLRSRLEGKQELA